MRAQNHHRTFPYTFPLRRAYGGFFAQKNTHGRFLLLKTFFLALLLCLPCSPLQATSFAANNAAHESHTKLTLSYAKGITKEDALEIIKSVAYMRAMKTEYKKISSQRVLSLGKQNTLEQMALVAAAHKPIFHILTHAALYGGDITADVRLKQRDLRLSTVFQELLRKNTFMEMYIEWFSLLQKNALLGEKALLIVSGIKKDTVTTPLTTLSGLAREAGQNLGALWLYHETLQDYETHWLKPHQAEKALLQACALAPKIPLLWVGLGEVQLQLDLPLRAIESLNKALALQNTRAQALYMRGLAYLRLQQPSLARSDLNTALSQQPHKAAWLSARGVSHLLLDEYDLMCEDLERACALGDCEGLQSVRKSALCLPQQNSLHEEQK